LGHLGKAAEGTVDDDTGDREGRAHLIVHQRSRATHAPPPQGDLRCCSAQGKAVEHGGKVVDFFPTKGDPGSPRVATATEIEGKEVEAQWEDLTCMRIAVMLVAGVSVHVDDARTSRARRLVRQRREAAMHSLPIA